MQEVAKAPLLLRVEEAGRLLNVGRTKAWALVARGELPSVRIGGSVRVPAEALREWVEARTEPLTKEPSGRP